MFSEEVTKVDIKLPERVKAEHEWRRLVAFHIDAWETWDRHQAMAKPWTNFSDSFDDGYDTARMPIIRDEKPSIVSRIVSIFSEVLT